MDLKLRDIDCNHLSSAARLAYAVMLFYGASPWTDSHRNLWEALTGESSATSKTLRNFARHTLNNEQTIPRPAYSSLGPQDLVDVIARDMAIRG